MRKDSSSSRFDDDSYKNLLSTIKTEPENGVAFDALIKQMTAYIWYKVKNFEPDLLALNMDEIDLVQDIVVKLTHLWRKRELVEKLPTKAAFMRYTWQMIKNDLMDKEKKHQNRQKIVPMESESPESHGIKDKMELASAEFWQKHPNFEVEYINHDLCQKAIAKLRSLGKRHENCASMLEMHHFGDEDYDVISLLYNRPTSSIRGELAHNRKELREIITQLIEIKILSQ